MVLNRVRVSNPQWLTYALKLFEYHPVGISLSIPEFKIFKRWEA